MSQALEFFYSELNRAETGRLNGLHCSEKIMDEFHAYEANWFLTRAGNYFLVARWAFEKVQIIIEQGQKFTIRYSNSEGENLTEQRLLGKY